MNKCTECGSYAINHLCHGRDGSDPELCDVCYWRVRATDYAALEAECEKLADELDRKSVITGDYIARCQRLAAERDALAAELAAIKGQQPVCEVSEETFSSDGTSDIITCNLPIGTKLYTLPAARKG